MIYDKLGQDNNNQTVVITINSQATCSIIGQIDLQGDLVTAKGYDLHQKYLSQSIEPRRLSSPYYEIKKEFKEYKKPETKSRNSRFNDEE